MRGQSDLAYLTDTAGDGATDVALGYGLQYLGIMVVGLVPFAVNQAYATNIKETGQTMVPMVASFVAVGSNALLDYLLIFGIGPFPELGVAGAALATVIARYIEAFIIIVWAHSHTGQNLYLKGSLYRIWHSGRGIEGDYREGISADAQRGSVGGGYDGGHTVLFRPWTGGSGGTEYSDDNHKPVQHHLSAAWFLHQYRGRTVSGRRRAGRSKGRRQQDDRVQCVLLRDRGRSYAGGRRIFPADLQYNGGDQGACDKLHRRIGDDHAVLFVQPCVVLYAAIGGKTMVTFLFDSVFTWIVVVPAAFVLARFTGLGIVSVYFLVQATELIKVVIGYRMVRSKVWLVQMV